MSDPGSGEYRFHSSREERLADRSEPDRPSGGIFRSNRSLTIILLDVLLVLLMFLIYLLFLQPDSELRVNGYTISGSGFLFDSDVYLTVTISSSEGTAPSAGAQSLVELAFPDGTRLTDVLPSDPEYPTVIRHVIPASALPDRDAERLAVDVRLAETRVDLDLRVSR